MRAVAATGWAVFLALFVRAHWTQRSTGRPVVSRRRVAYLALLAQAIAAALPFVSARPSPPSLASLALFVSFVAASCTLAVWALHHLGPFWSLDACLRANHQLVQTGPYRWLRHPIYTAFAGMVLATNATLASAPVAAVSLALFVAGTELRIRNEEKVLLERFGEQYRAYRNRSYAWLPPLR